MVHRWLAVAWSAALALCVPACAERSATAPRLVLLYATCTLNRDFLSPYDPEVRFTPHLAEFGRDAVVFTKHQTDSGQSGVSFASLFSGSQSNRHGVYTIPQRLSDDVRLITEIFRDAGYVVHAWLGHGMASAPLNYAQGVERENVSGTMLTADDPRFVGVLEELRSDKDAKAFLVTNFTVTHGPYRGHELERFCRLYPEECEGVLDASLFPQLRRIYEANALRLAFDFDATVKRLRIASDEVVALAAALELLYKTGVFHLDELFGDVVDRLAEAGLLEQSVIAFTADHGEVLFRENAVFQWSHSLQLAPEVLRVPLLLYAPGFGVAPGRYDAVTRSVDVLPTLAGLSGITLDAGELAGVDVSPVLRGEGPAPELLAFSHTSIVPRVVIARMGGWDCIQRTHPRAAADLMWVALRRGDTVYKVRHPGGGEGEPAVYDWSRDPEETENLYDPADDEHRRMLERLAEYKKILVDAHRGDVFAERDPSTERQVELLQGLGYIE